MNDDQIRSAVDAMLKGEGHTWVEISALLHEVKKIRYWCNDASSFTNWLEQFGEKIGLKRATLWRYSSSGEKYEYMRQRILNSKPSLRFECPPLAGLPKHVSPENLELLEKLSRTMEIEDFAVMMVEVIKGSMRRSILREKWQAFRPSLDGQTARNTSYKTIRVDRNDQVQYGKLIEGEIFDALKKNGTGWLSITDPLYYRLQLNVYPDAKNIGHSIYLETEDISLDAVALVKVDANAFVDVHAIEITSSFTDDTMGKLEAMRMYCNATWLAIPRNVGNKMDFKKMPQGVGVISLSDENLIETLVLPTINYHTPYIDRTLKGWALKIDGAPQSSIS